MARPPKNVRPRSGHPTIATIAEETGLSRATVTHVLNGRAAEQRIRPETGQRVLAAAQELGYRANPSARAIRAGRFGSVALVQSQLGEYLPAELLHGLTTGMAARDLNLVLTHVANVDESSESYLAQVQRALSVDGVFINRHGDSTPSFLERIRRLRIPAVFLNSKQEADCVYPDELHGGQLAVEYLLRLGHERIAYLETEERRLPHYSERDRRCGYERAMALAGRRSWVRQIPVEWRSAGDGHADERVKAVMALLERSDRPTAVVAYELTESLAVVRAALQLGLRIPEDLSLIHFHHQLSDRYFLPIHTVSNMMQQVGEGAVAMLLEKIENPEQELPSQAIPEALLEGATCMPPHSRS
jgi:LacI family transcriptional regulator